MSRICHIVKDLLPLYVEGMVSEETASFIEEHLQACSNCKDLLNAMKGIDEESINSDDSKVDDGTVIKNVKNKLKKKTISSLLYHILIILL